MSFSSTIPLDCSDSTPRGIHLGKASFGEAVVEVQTHSWQTRGSGDMGLGSSFYQHTSILSNITEMTRAKRTAGHTSS
jgi:hypothetical protein